MNDMSILQQFASKLLVKVIRIDGTAWKDYTTMGEFEHLKQNYFAINTWTMDTSNNRDP